MRVRRPGHVYEVENVGDGFTVEPQVIRFVRRRDDVGEPLAEDQREVGILSQELLRVLIDRTLYLYAEAPCEEDTRIIEHLRAALVLYESRAARRAIERLSKPELAKPCPVCHHILCGVHLQPLPRAPSLPAAHEDPAREDPENTHVRDRREV